VIQKRVSANMFDTGRKLSDQEIRELVEAATHAPSSFNIQHWRFVAVTDQAAKERLKALAWGQPKVADAAVTFIVLGDLLGYKKLASIVKKSVDAGIVPAAMADGWVPMAENAYSSNPQLARDEAIRSGAMAAMVLMLAAADRGLVSGPMIGFDPEGVKKEFAISERYVPVMLLPVGYERDGNWTRKPRLTVDEVLAMGTGKGLE
ncbi:MAG TPA: nitroreductase family protein, partial [Thermoanaerobaculia bacterium]